MPSLILIRPGQTGQRFDSIGRTVLQTVVQKLAFVITHLALEKDTWSSMELSNIVNRCVDCSDSLRHQVRPMNCGLRHCICSSTAAD